MDKKAKHLAYCRRHLAHCRKVEAEYQADVDEAKARIEESSKLWCWRLEQRREFLAAAEADVKDARGDVKAAEEASDG